MRNAKFDSIDFTGTKFIECDLEKSTFVNCNLQYVTFDKCQLNYQTIIKNAPTEYNWRKNLLRSLRTNASTMGDSANAQILLELELEVERKESFAITVGESEYFATRYELHERIKHGLAWLGHWLQKGIWGYGLRLRSLLRSATILIAMFATFAASCGNYRVAGNELPRNLSFGEAVYFSAITFATVGYGEVVPVGWCARFLAGAEGLTGVLFLGFFAAAVYRRFSR